MKFPKQHELRPCPSCGEEVRRHAMTCPKCGQKLSGLENAWRDFREAYANEFRDRDLPLIVCTVIIVGGLLLVRTCGNPFDIPSDYYDNKQQETPIKRPR